MNAKILLLCLFLFVGSVMNAQFTVETHAGDPILDGDVVSFGEYGDPEGELPFYVYNQSSSDINMRIQFVSAVNADGSMMQLCFGLCYTSISLGESYPPNGDFITIPAGQHQASDGDHFMNYDPGTGSQVLEYVFKFYQVDDTGHPIGTPLTMTYSYDPSLGLGEVEKINLSVYPTVVTNLLTVETDKPLTAGIFDLQGRLVKSLEIAAGENEIGMRNLNSGLYLMRFSNQSGIQLTRKIIVK